MIKFYITRLEKLSSNEERLEYLNNIVASSKRAEVKAEYNKKHSDDPITD